MNDSITNLCACGCGEPLPPPQFPSRVRKYIRYHSARGRKLPRKSLAERFWEKVDGRGPDDCWEWTAYRDKDGYGTIRPSHRGNKPSIGAHRVSYEINVGEVPDGLWVLHTCDNPPCVNPAHLFLGDNIDNVQDCIKKGRKNPARGEAAGSSKFKEHQITEMRQKYATGNYTLYEIADEYNTSAGHVCRIVNRKVWRHIK